MKLPWKWHPNLGTGSCDNHGNQSGQILNPTLRPQDRIRIPSGMERYGWASKVLRLSTILGKKSTQSPGWVGAGGNCPFFALEPVRGPHLHPSLGSLSRTRGPLEARMKCVEYKAKKLRHTINSERERRTLTIQNDFFFKTQFTCRVVQGNGTGFHSDPSNLLVFSAVHVP